MWLEYFKYRIFIFLKYFDMWLIQIIRYRNLSLDSILFIDFDLFSQTFSNQVLIIENNLVFYILKKCK